MSAAIKKKLIIEIDVIDGNMNIINEDDMSYIEVMGTLECAKMMFIKDWMGEQD